MRSHCCYTGKYRGAADSISNLKYIVPKEINVVLHNESHYDHNFITKEIAKEFERELNFLGENTEKCTTFSIPITDEVKMIHKNGKDITETISYRQQFIHRSLIRLMASSSNPVNNLAEGIHKTKCKGGHENKKCEMYRIDTKIVNLVFYKQTLINLIRYKFPFFNRNHQKQFNEDLIKRFFNTYKFSNYNVNNFILLLRKGVYTYEYMGD